MSRRPAPQSSWNHVAIPAGWILFDPVLIGWARERGYVAAMRTRWGGWWV